MASEEHDELVVEVKQLEVEAVGVLRRCLNRVVKMLDDAEELDDVAKELKVMNRATAVANSLITNILSLQRQWAKSDLHDPEELKGLDPELLKQASENAKRVKPDTYDGDGD